MSTSASRTCSPTPTRSAARRPPTPTTSPSRSSCSREDTMPFRPWSLGFLGLALALAAPPAARGAVMAQVVPVKYALTCRPGEVVAREVEIANQGDAPVVVRVTWSDWQMDDDGNLTLVREGSTPNS